MRINPLEDHALTSFIHALICVFIYLGFGKDNLSFIASLLFAFNPTNNQGSVWISGRAYALAASRNDRSNGVSYVSFAFFTYIRLH